MILLDDVGRCMGQDNIDHNRICPHRAQCERYLNRAAGGPYTPYYAHLCRDHTYQHWIIGDEVEVPEELLEKINES
jgi:hypothetical protein